MQIVDNNGEPTGESIEMAHIEYTQDGTAEMPQIIQEEAIQEWEDAQC